MTFHLCRIRSSMRGPFDKVFAGNEVAAKEDPPRCGPTVASSGHTVGVCAYPITDLSKFLRGSWDLARDIVGADGAVAGRFAGVGVFTVREGLLYYEESGRLRIGDRRSEATRSLRYRPERAEYCTVWFDDGHFFHDLRLGSGIWQVGHPCGQDHYGGTFEVFDSDQWRQSWY